MRQWVEFEAEVDPPPELNLETDSCISLFGEVELRWDNSEKFWTVERVKLLSIEADGPAGVVDVPIPSGPVKTKLIEILLDEAYNREREFNDALGELIDGPERKDEE